MCLYKSVWYCSFLAALLRNATAISLCTKGSRIKREFTYHHQAMLFSSSDQLNIFHHFLSCVFKLCDWKGKVLCHWFSCNFPQSHLLHCRHGRPSGAPIRCSSSQHLGHCGVLGHCPGSFVGSEDPCSCHRCWSHAVYYIGCGGIGLSHWGGGVCHW